MSEQNSEVFGC